MFDIEKCSICDENFYIDNGSRCSVCGEYFCPNCDLKNGSHYHSNEAHNYYYICNECLEKGVDYINQEHMDDAIFTQQELL